MSLPRIICPHNRALLRSLKPHHVAVRIGHWEKTAAAAHDVRDAGHRLFSVIAESPVALDEVALHDDWKEIPLAIVVPSMGSFAKLAAKLQSWRSFDLCIHLPAASASQQTAVRILSSLGLRTCAMLDRGQVDWEHLADLMTYAVLGHARHAPIEPFATIADGYRGDANLDWGSVYFDDPAQFLHLDEEGRVALSRSELERGEFVAPSLDECQTAAASARVEERKRSWTSFFLDNHECSYCPGWKVCMGRFSAWSAANRGCAKFFSEAIAVARQAAELKKAREEKPAWQQ